MHSFKEMLSIFIHSFNFVAYLVAGLFILINILKQLMSCSCSHGVHLKDWLKVLDKEIHNH